MEGGEHFARRRCWVGTGGAQRLSHPCLPRNFFDVQGTNKIANPSGNFQIRNLKLLNPAFILIRCFKKENHIPMRPSKACVNVRGRFLQVPGSFAQIPMPDVQGLRQRAQTIPQTSRSLRTVPTPNVQDLRQRTRKAPQVPSPFKQIPTPAVQGLRQRAQGSFKPKVPSNPRFLQTPFHQRQSTSSSYPKSHILTASTMHIFGKFDKTAARSQDERRGRHGCKSFAGCGGGGAGHVVRVLG